MAAAVLSLFLAFMMPVALHAPVDSYAEPEQQTAQQLLERGLRAEEEGNYREALSIWRNAKAKLASPSTGIGSHYIRLVTEQHMTKYFKAASAMYYWGLSGGDLALNRDELEQEFRFMEPLLEKEERKKLRDLLEENDPLLIERMRRWWVSVDPTPGTVYNERLIEHWQRIAYVRKHFDRTEESVYGTDERGPVYVKWGEPKWRFDGHLQITKFEAEQAASMWGAGSEANVQNIAGEALHMHKSPYYEVWVYLAEHIDHEENITLLFGDLPLGGFGRARTVEDFIPNRGFTLSQRYNHVSIQRKMVGLPQEKSFVNPAMVLQWLYYKQLATKDHYFAQLFWQLERDWKRGRVGKARGGMSKQKHAHVTIQRFNRAPNETSTYLKDFPEIPLDVWQYRMLDKNNRPIVATFVESRPQRSFLEDLAFNQHAMIDSGGPSGKPGKVRDALESYTLFHGMELRDADGQRVGGERLQTTLIFDGKEMQASSGSVFTAPNLSNGGRQYFYAELHNTHERSSPRLDSPFDDKLRGLGRVLVEQPEPLNSDPEKLQMSDLILGYDKRDSTGRNRFLPFVVSNDRRIPEGEQLVVHFEVYHLQKDTDGLRKFRVDYEIKPLNFLGWTREREDRPGVRLFFEQYQSRYRENLEIDAIDLEPGRYVLRLRAEDGISGQTVNREIEFEVLERN